MSVAEIGIPVNPNVAVPASRTIVYELRNSNSWLDLCPVLNLKASDEASNWDVRCTLNDKDVTDAIFKTEGVACVGDFRLWHRNNPPQSPHLLKITVTPKKGATSQPAKQLKLSLTMSPSPGNRQIIEQRLELRVIPSANIEAH